jgi:hypothetical protein
MKNAIEMLPTVESVKRADVGPSDVVVVKADDVLDDATRRFIEEHLQPVWPNNKIIVLDRELSIEIARSTQQPQLTIGDRMRLSVALITELSAQPQHESQLVRVVDIKVEDECKTLIVERVVTEPL